MSPDERLSAPSAARNRDPILAVLRRVLPESGLVLEIASGTGQHVVHFARALPKLDWQPTELDAQGRRSIAAWIASEGLANVRAPLALDVRALPWPVPAADALVCANLIHIAPWAVTEALFAGAALALREASPLVLYGPYALQGRHTAPSNAAFDRDLRERNPEWGVRDLDEVAAAALARGFALVEAVPMPANNFCVHFRKGAPGQP